MGYVGTWGTRSSTRVACRKCRQSPIFLLLLFPHYFLTISKRLSPLVGACRKCRQSPIFLLLLSPHYFLTISKRLSPLVGACRKCRQSPILLILLSPHYFQITNREPVLSAYPYSQLGPRPNRNTRLAQLWKATQVTTARLATKGCNLPDKI